MILQKLEEIPQKLTLSSPRSHSSHPVGKRKAQKDTNKDITAFFQKYEPFVNKSAKVLMAETVAPTLDRMFVEIRYKSLNMETYMVK